MVAIETLAVISSMLVGTIGAGTGILAVYVQSRTQRDTLRETTASQAAQQKAERLTAWRRERYGELLAAVGEFYGAVRSMNLALDLAARNPQGLTRGVGDDESIDQLYAAISRFQEVNGSGRILVASMQVADREVAETAHKIADAYFLASSELVRLAGRNPGEVREEELEKAYSKEKSGMDETNDLVRELNQRVEYLISAGEIV